MIIVIISVILLTVVALIVYSIRRTIQNRKALAALAVAQGWTALPADSSALYGYLPKYLQNHGERQSYDTAYQATVEGIPVTFFHFQYIDFVEEYDEQTQAMQRREQSHDFNVFHATMTESYPSVLLLKHGLLSRLANLDESWGMQHINLEGDFNKHFDVYITKGTQIEALTLLTPEVMVQMMDTASKASFQCVGQSLIMSFEEGMLTPDKATNGIKILTDLVKNIENKTTSQFAA